METTRTYTQTARAEATAQTRRRILEACADQHARRPVAEVSLGDIATAASVSVQTVLRHFGSRAELVEQAVAFAREGVVASRRTPVGDVTAAIRVIVDHYERDGDAVLLMLAQERTEPLMARITEDGRRLHRDWVVEVFAPYLAEPGAEAEQLADLLVVATDVYTWKLLRRDRGLSRSTTENRIAALVAAVLTTHQKGMS